MSTTDSNSPARPHASTALVPAAAIAAGAGLGFVIAREGLPRWPLAGLLAATAITGSTVVATLRGHTAAVGAQRRPAAVASGADEV